MRHPSDSEAWKHFSRTHPSFPSKCCNVGLGLCTTGFQPFGKSRQQYSSWPVIVTVATPKPGPTRLASPNRNPGDARLILFIYILLRFLFQKLSRHESPAQPEWRIRTGARFTPMFSFILSKHLINLFSCGSGFSFGQAHNHLQFQCNSVGP